MRWLWLLIAVLGFAVPFTSHSPGLIAIGLFAGLTSLLAFALSMAAARIAETAQPVANLFADAEVSAMRARANQKKKAALAQSAPVAQRSAEDRAQPTRS